MRVARRFEFDAAHRLPDHAGRCRFLHGHRYAVEVEVEGGQLVDGCVVDFGVLKELVGGWIDEHWDHATLVSDCDESLLGWCKANEQRSYALDGPPTIENMVHELVVVLRPTMTARGLALVRVRGYETPTCWAEWKAP
ncbi:MAG: 6-pyruvoyl tetrahydropterin synthase family protein [Dehalococcoidia bacterium]